MSIRTSKSMSRLTAMPPPTPTRRSSTTSLSSMGMMASSSVVGGGCTISSNSVCSTFPTPRKTNVKYQGQGSNVSARSDDVYQPQQQQQRPRQNNDHNDVPPTRKAKHIQREYQLLQSQTLLLLGTAFASFLLFLLFTLPFAALIGLTVMITSLGACFLVAFSAAKTRYQLELQHPLGLVRYLPEKIRSHLTEKSLHDCLSQSSSKESLTSLSRCQSKESLASMGQTMYQVSSKGSLSSMTQQQQYGDQGGRNRHNRRGAR